MKATWDWVLKVLPYLWSERHFLLRPEQTHKGVTILLSLASLARKQWQDISQQCAVRWTCSHARLLLPKPVPKVSFFSPFSHWDLKLLYDTFFGCNCTYEPFQPKCPWALNTFLQKWRHTLDYQGKSTRTQLHPKKLLFEYAFQHRGPCLMAGCRQRQLQQL